MEEMIKIICEDCKQEICLIPRDIEAIVEVGCTHCMIKSALLKGHSLDI